MAVDMSLAATQQERRLTWLLLAIAAAARLPFWWHGFGGHPDEWLVIRSGLDIWLHGIYYPSRPTPGYPLNEILMGGLAWLGGEALCAAAATLASLVALFFIRALGMEQRHPRSRLHLGHRRIGRGTILHRTGATRPLRPRLCVRLRVSPELTVVDCSGICSGRADRTALAAGLKVQPVGGHSGAAPHRRLAQCRRHAARRLSR